MNGSTCLLPFACALLLLAGGAAFAKEQVITPDPASQTRAPSTALTIDVRYTASDGDATLTGLGLRIHYDSRKLTFTAATNVLASGLMGQQPPQEDTANHDGDTSTDRFVLVSWADFAGNWPGQIPARLLTVGFATAASFSGSTTVRFSAASTAAGYTLAATPATVTASGTPPVGPPISEAGPHLYFVPTCAHAAGVGTTQWQSDLVLHNPNPTSASVNLYLLKRDLDNQSVRGKTASVGAGASLRLADVVLGTFGESSAAGAMLVGSTQPLLVSSRTFNTAPAGTFGQYVEGFAASRAVAGTAPVRLVQLTRNSGYRTNIGFVNATATATAVQVDLHRADGSHLGRRDFSLPPWGARQETDTFSKVTSADVDDGYAVVRSSSGAARYFVYASVVDARTGDPVTVVPPLSASAPAPANPADDDAAKQRARLARPKRSDSVPVVEKTHARLDPSLVHMVDVGSLLSNDEPDATQTIFTDGFEGAFPGSWSTSRGQSAPDTVWGRSTFRKSAGNASLWCAGGGSQASSPGGSYVPYMNTWVKYGPFSLADATAAVITFDYWMKTEQEWTSGETTWGDPFKWMISRDGTSFHGFKTSGDSDGWKAKTFDLATVTAFTALGQPQIWFALVFQSDVSDQMEGVYVDNVVITKTTGGTCTTPAAPVLTAPASVQGGTPFTVSWTATSPDTAYELQEATNTAFTDATTYPVTGTSRTFTRTVTATTTYSYRVRATFACGGTTLTSAWSATRQTVVSAGTVSGESLWVPGTAALPGSQGSNWRTDLQVHNAGTTRAEYQLALHRRGESTTTPPAQSFALDPGRSTRYANVLQSIFATTGAATLRVTTPSPELIVTSRTYNDQPAGTFGQFVPGVWTQHGTGAGTPVRLIQLAQSASTTEGFRTNLGLCNLSSTTITVEVKLHRGNGTLLGTRSYTLRPFESIQRDRVFTEVTTQNLDDAFAVLRTDTAGGRFLAFASVIDNRSNDPISIPAR